MEFSEEIISFVEFFIPCAVLAVLAISHILTKNLFKWLIFLFIVTEIAVVSCRPQDYNSDTSNYASYVEGISDAVGADVLAVSKFEPLHLLLAVMAGDFRAWIVLEGLAAICLTGFLITQLRRPETISIILGCSQPLYSSSIRYAVGLLAVTSAMLLFPRRYVQFVATSLVGFFTHASLTVAGVAQQRRLWLTFICLLAFFFMVWNSQDLLERSGGNQEFNGRAKGLRSFACIILVIAYLRVQIFFYREKLFVSDVLTAFMIFFSTLFFFPILNRWLIILMAIIATDCDRRFPSTSASRRVGSAFSVVIYTMLEGASSFDSLNRIMLMNN